MKQLKPLLLATILLLAGCQGQIRPVEQVQPTPQSEQIPTTESLVEEDTESTIYQSKSGLTLTVPATWADTAYLHVDTAPHNLFQLLEVHAYDTFGEGMGHVWSILQYTLEEFDELYGEMDSTKSFGAELCLLGWDDHYAYVLGQPTDVQFIFDEGATAPIRSQQNYQELQTQSSAVLTRFLLENDILPNEQCPSSAVYGPLTQASKTVAFQITVQKVLSSEKSFFLPQEDTHVTLDTLEGLNTTAFALVDLDGDAVQEVAVQLEATDGSYTDILILHYQNENMVGYLRPERWIHSLKTDGSYEYSFGGEDYGVVQRVSFKGSQWQAVDVTYSIADDAQTVYFSNETPITEEEFQMIFPLQDGKEAVTWYELTTQTILEYITTLEAPINA